MRTRILPHSALLRLWLMVLLVGCCVAARGQGEIDSVSLRMQRQLSLFPQEKVCLHADRTVCMPGDSVCLKVYATDAATLLPVLNSQFAYVELLSSKNTIVASRRLIASTNMYTGHINLPPDLPSGIYYLWAYTLYSAQVKNYDCLIPIQVGTPPSSSKEHATSPEMRFFPEGGYIVEGASSMVAFEATNARGDSIEVSGEVVDSNGAVVSHFSTAHRGMGCFPLTAERGETYHAVIRDGRGRKHSFPLPPARSDVAAIRCRLRSNEAVIRVNKGDDVSAARLYLLVHCRGREVSLQEVSEGVSYHLPLQSLPAGVNSVLLLDDQARVLSERLLFSANSNQQLPLQISSPKADYHLRDSIPVTLTAGDAVAEEVAFLSLSVTDDAITLGHHSPSLWSQLLLTSDLPGFISQPDDYFSPTYRYELLDLLMMIHGWRRYDMSQVLQGRYEEAKTDHEYSQRVKGRLRGVARNNAVAGAQVVLAIPRLGYVAQTVSDSLGVFEFADLNYPDNADVFVYALRQKRRRCLVEIERQKRPFVPDLLYDRKASGMVAWAEPDEGLMKYYSSDSHLLEEIVVEGRHDYDQSLFTDNTSLTFDRCRIDDGDYPNVGMMLLDTNVLDVNFTTGSIRTTFPSGLSRREHVLGSDESADTVLLYVNGMHIPDINFDDLELDDVLRVDLYLGPKAVPFGLGDGVAVLNITMRNSINRSTGTPFNNRVMQLEGYQAPVEYYFPRYPGGSKPSAIMPDVRRTIYWNPYLRMNASEPLQLDFYSADLPTTYTIRAEGITTRGRIINSELKLGVK